MIFRIRRLTPVTVRESTLAESLKRRYSQFRFQLSWDSEIGSDEVALDQSVRAGFEEVSGIGSEITPAEYREGDIGGKAQRKITGMIKYQDVTFKRGIIGSLELRDWLNETRKGTQNQLKTVTVALLSEDRKTVAQKWQLLNARLIKHTTPSVEAKGADLAIDELVFAVERIEMSRAHP